MKKTTIITATTITLILVIVLIFAINENSSEITNFEECVASGNPIMESYPRKCNANGQTFTEIISEQKIKKYISRDKDECMLIKFQCSQESVPFFDEIGCGCEGLFNDENSLAEYFIEKAIENSFAIPIEGFDPELYIGVFPKLLKSDFDNTKAIGGIWKLTNGELVFIRDDSEGITSADGTLTNEGVKTLIKNLESRLNIKVQSVSDLDNLISLISKEKNKIFCTPESRNAEVCTAIYSPVCGWSDPERVQCIKYPCAQEYDNPCNACNDEKVLYYTSGNCPN